MSRRAQVHLRAADQPWRDGPMPGAGSPIQMVLLESSTAPFAILGRFPAGFDRSVPGGYDAAEEFVVLAGEVVLDDELAIGAGTLAHIGAGRLRRSLRAPEGALVLAWFAGDPLFRAEERLVVAPEAIQEVHDLAGCRPGLSIRTPESEWSAGLARDWPARADGFDDRFWASSAGAWRGGSDDSVLWRTQRKEFDG